MKPPKSVSLCRSTSKVRPVPIPQMRVPPAGVVQRKFNRAQAEKYAADFDLNALGHPIVNLRAGVYWIVDGQHRIAALKLMGWGEEHVDCEVYEDLTDAQMADIFLSRDNRRRISPFEKFQVACTAEWARELAIQRIVEANGVRITKDKEQNCVGCVSTLGKVFDSAGEVVLGQSIRTVKNAYAGDPAGFDGQVIEAVALIFNRYNGRTNDKELSQRLSQMQYGVRGLLRRAEAQRERTGNQKTQCIAATIVEMYNKGSRRHRLPSWWKENVKE